MSACAKHIGPILRPCERCGEPWLAHSWGPGDRAPRVLTFSALLKGERFRFVDDPHVWNDDRGRSVPNDFIKVAARTYKDVDGWWHQALGAAAVETHTAHDNDNHDDDGGRSC